MSAEIDQYLSLLDRRLILLRELAEQLVACRKEFVSMNLEGMYGSIAHQEDICRKIQSLQPGMTQLQQTCARQLQLKKLDEPRTLEESARARRLREVMSDLRNTQDEVSRLNRIHAAYLRRCGRTVNMLMNYLANYAFTYARPVGPVLPAKPGAGRN
jgi:hypothetical protein